MNPVQSLRVLRSRWYVLLAGFVLVVGIVAAITFSLPKRYTATTLVLIDVKAPELFQGAIMSPTLVPGYMATQVDIVRSYRVATAVVEALGLDKGPEVREQFASEVRPGISIGHLIAGKLLDSLSVQPARESNVISIGFTGADPAFAARVANAFAQAYIATSLALRVEPAKTTSAWFDERIKGLRSRVDATQRSLSSYQRDNRIVSVDERIDVENARLAELSSQFVAIQAQTIDAGKRAQAAREFLERGQSPESLPAVMSNTGIANLKLEITRQEARRSEVGSRLGKNHPQYVSLENEISTLKRRLDEEMHNVVRALESELGVSRQREGQLRASLEAQRARVLQIKQQRDELAVLTRDAENAQRTYDQVSARLSISDLESQSNQTNVVQLDAATPPGAPSSPNVLGNLLAAAVLGTVLGAMGAFAAELADRRLRAPDDLARIEGVPFLVSL